VGNQGQQRQDRAQAPFQSQVNGPHISYNIPVVFAASYDSHDSHAADFCAASMQASHFFISSDLSCSATSHKNLKSFSSEVCPRGYL